MNDTGNVNNTTNVEKLLSGQLRQQLSKRHCFVGFDAFVDYITKPVAFASLHEYAEFLASQNEKSFSVELSTPQIKIGGNNPITSNIMSRFGVNVVSAGVYGKPHIEKIFEPLSNRCKLISFGNPGHCTALEFSVNKLFNYYNMDAADFTLENLLQSVSEKELLSILENAELMALVNLGEQPAVLNILDTLFSSVFPKIKQHKKKCFFVDMSDCSRMTRTDLARVKALFSAMKPYGTSVLSTNENEFAVLNNVFCENGGAEKGAGLRAALGVDTLVLRTLSRFYAFCENGAVQADNVVVENPRCLTGAGDAQNAGICLGLLNGFTIEEALQAGVLVGNRHIRGDEIGS